MRILINATSVQGGGGRVVASELVNALADEDANLELSVLVKSASDLDLADGHANVSVVECGLPARYPALRLAWEQVFIPRAMRDHDVLLGVASVGVVWRAIPQVVIAQNAHLFERLGHRYPLRTRVKSWLQRTMFTLTMRRGARCITVSEYMKECIAARYPATAARTDVVPSAPPSWATATVHAPSDPSNILWVGDDMVHKNLAEFVDAAALIRTALPAVRLSAIGTSGRLAAIGQSSETERRAADVEYLGTVDGETRAALFSSSTMVVVTSMLESSSLVALEAARLRIPIVASDIPAHREILDERSLYDTGDVDNLAELAIKMLSDDEYLRNAVMANQRKTESRSWRSAAGSYLRILSDVAVGE